MSRDARVRAWCVHMHRHVGARRACRPNHMLNVPPSALLPLVVAPDLEAALVGGRDGLVVATNAGSVGLVGAVDVPADAGGSEDTEPFLLAFFADGEGVGSRRDGEVVRERTGGFGGSCFRVEDVGIGTFGLPVMPPAPAPPAAAATALITFAALLA